MSFLQPLFLYALPVVGLPILIHLIFRQTFKRREWAAMEYLMRAVEKLRRRLLIENILLLLLRMLAVLLVVMAFSRPVVKTWFWFLKAVTKNEGDVVLIIDTSYSMMLQQGSKTTFDRGIDQARELVRSLDGRGNIALIKASDQPETVMEFSPNHESVLRTLGNLKATGGATDIAKTLEETNELLSNVRYRSLGRKKVFFLTDLMQYGWKIKGRKVGRIDTLLAQLAEKVDHFSFVDLGQDRERFNLSVDRVASEDDIVGKELPAQFVATISNQGERPVSGLRVHFLVNGARRGPGKTIDRLGPRESREVVFSEIFATAGPTAVTVAVEGDKYLTIDDRRHHAFEVVDRIKVLLVDGDPRGWTDQAEVHYLAHALEPEISADGRSRYLFERRIRNRQEFHREKLAGSQFDMVALCNVAYLSEEKEAELKSFVEKGGGLLLFLGDKVRPDVYNERLLPLGLLPAKLGAKPSGDVGYDAKDVVALRPDFSHPLFVFFSEMTKEFKYRVIGRYYPVEPVDDPSVKVLARYRDESGPPAIIERRLGRGRILMVTTTADEGWHFLTQRDIILAPLYYRMATYLVSDIGGNRDVLVHSPIEFPLREIASEVRVARPDAKGMPQQRTTTLPGTAEMVSYPKTDQPGIYRIELTRSGPTGAEGRTDRIYYAVGVQPEEGNLEHLGRKGLVKLYPSLGDKPYVFGKKAITLNISGGADKEGQIWQLLIAALLLVLLAESWLARRTSR